MLLRLDNICKSFGDTVAVDKLTLEVPEGVISGIAREATLGLLSVVIAYAAMVWLTGKVFRIGILMYGKRPTLPEIIKWVRY